MKCPNPMLSFTQNISRGDVLGMLRMYHLPLIDPQKHDRTARMHELVYHNLLFTGEELTTLLAHQ
jgi:hypothetical protein